MAYEPRLWIAYVSSSGEGGAKLHRRNWGEIVENVAGSSEYHWMAGNFIKYAGPLNWNDLPVDSHELIALCAPRPVFLSAGKAGGWRWLGRRQGHLPGRRWRRPGLSAARQEGSRHYRISAHRNPARHGRYGLPPARQRAHRRAELALLPGFRREAHVGRGACFSLMPHSFRFPLAGNAVGRTPWSAAGPLAGLFPL